MECVKTNDNKIIIHCKDFDQNMIKIPSRVLSDDGEYHNASVSFRAGEMSDTIRLNGVNFSQIDSVDVATCVPVILTWGKSVNEIIIERF